MDLDEEKSKSRCWRAAGRGAHVMRGGGARIWGSWVCLFACKHRRFNTCKFSGCGARSKRSGFGSELGGA